MINKFFLALVIVISPICCTSQILNIKVFDQTTNLPIPYATVFINGSKISGICDSLGKYKMNYTNKKNIVINISSIGYALKTIEIFEYHKNNIEVGLENISIELEGFSVRKPIKRGYQKYGYLFFRELIGFSEFSKKCKILNPEVINFFFDEETGKLTAKSSEPILIENNALGYLITLYLNGFEIDQKNQNSEYSGLFYFKDLIVSKDNETINSNREGAYNGSIQHFFTSLYDDRLKENGFEIKCQQSIPIHEAYHHFNIKIDTFIISDFTLKNLLNVLNNNHKSFFKRFSKKSLSTFSAKVNQWVNQNEEYFTYGISSKNSRSKLRIKLEKFKNEIRCVHLITNILDEKNIIDNYYINSEPILSQQIIEGYDKNSKLLNFQENLRVHYLNEPEEKLFFKSENGVKLNFQTSTISLNDKVTFFKNGDYDPFENLLISGYWTYEKLDKMLPVDYK